MIGAAPVPATFFDGHSAQRHPVNVSVNRDGTGLVIDKQSPGGTPLVWPLDRLRALSDQANANILTLTLHAQTEDETPRDPARLILSDPQWVAWVRQNAPKLAKRDTRPGTARKILSRTALAIVAIGFIVFAILPRMSDFLAERMPLETEIRFGKAVVAQMERFLGGSKSGGLVCTNPAGLEALKKMKARLITGQDLQYDLNLSVLDHSMVNAFAAPGGNVVLIRGLLEKADTADEVAAVLAHEIGHVEARDPTRLTLRAAGSAGILSIILGDVSGGTIIGILGDRLLQTSYTRQAEAEADAFALRMMNAADISTAGMAGFFDRIGKADGADFPEYLSSHPASQRRADRARSNADGQSNTSPVLSDAEWQSLKTICKP